MNDETLAELLESVLQKHGWSGRQFAERAQKLGHDVSAATINNIRIGRYPRVSEKAIAAIADVAELPEARVRKAAGLPPIDRNSEQALYALNRELTPEEQREALRMYREVVRSLKRLRGDTTGDDTQPNRPRG